MIPRLLTMLLLLAIAPPAPAAAPAGSTALPSRLAVAAKGPPAPASSARRDSTRRRVARPAAPDTAIVHVGPEGTGTRAFVAYPPGQSSAPSVVIAHEWWGLNAQIREVARRLARQGYVVIVPDLYHGKVASDRESAHVLARGLDEDGALGDLASAADWLATDPRSARRRRGVLGFCMGGGLALRTALADPALSAVVMFYGVPEPRPERLASLRAPLLGHFGAEDQGIDTSRVEAFRRALEGSQKRAEVYVYPGAGHAFMNEEQESFRPEAARLAWVRTLDFLQKNLKVLP